MSGKKDGTVFAGSMTVEAALLIPLFLGAMLFVVTLSVFLYNRAAATALSGTGAVLAAGMEHAGKAEIQRKVETYLNEEKDHFPLAEKVGCKVNVSAMKVRVQVTVSGSIFSPFLWGGKRSASHTGDAKVQRLDPAEYVRMIRIAEKKRNGN